MIIRVHIIYKRNNLIFFLWPHFGTLFKEPLLTFHARDYVYHFNRLSEFTKQSAVIFFMTVGVSNLFFEPAFLLSEKVSIVQPAAFIFLEFNYWIRTILHPNIPRAIEKYRQKLDTFHDKNAEGDEYSVFYFF